MKNVNIKGFFVLCLPFLASAAALTVIQPSVGWSWLAWVSLVPFILVCSSDVKPLGLAVIAYIISLCYWLGNLYWIAPVTPSGWIAFCLYTALLWPMLVFAVRLCMVKKIPLFIAVPVLFVGAERLQGLFLGGFFWRLLAHSQYANITLIQIADIFGAAGLSFLIAMVNGLLAELFIAGKQKRLLRIAQFFKIALVCAALVGTVAYGQWRIEQSDKFIEAGPLVASLQSNVPQSVKESFEADNIIFDDLLQKSNAAAEAGAQLIVWPETMVQANLEPRMQELLDPSHDYRIFDKALREHSKDSAFILVGAYGGKPQIKPDWTIGLLSRYNSAFLYQPDGSKAEKQYNKIHLVPFGEVVPFKKSAPWLHKLLMKFTPYDYDYSLDYGTEYTVFEMAAGEGQARQIYNFSVMICYEGAIPAIARRFALDGQGRKRLDWLVNISNDGWFVQFEDGKVSPSTELAQHTATCVFRAVENRLAVLRSVNTGISCLIETTGRIKNGFLSGNLPNKAMDRKAVAGWFVDRVPIDKRTTFFSKYGQWLDFCCAVGFIGLVILPISKRITVGRKTRVRTNEKGQKG